MKQPMQFRPYCSDTDNQAQYKQMKDDTKLVLS